MTTLPLRIAQRLARTPITNQPAQAMLARLFAGLSPAGQLQCRAELLECRAAKRGERIAS